MDGFVKPTLKQNHRALYWALWFLWFCIVSFVLSATCRLWPAQNYNYYNYFSASSRSEDITGLILLALTLISVAGLILGMIGSDRVIKDEKKLLEGQSPMAKAEFLEKFSGLKFFKPHDRGDVVYTVTLTDAAHFDSVDKNDYLVRIGGPLYLELKEFYDQGHLGFIVGENFK